MKLLLKFTLLLLVLTTITSCLGGLNTPENLDVEKDFKLFKSKKFSIMVPDYVSETDQLNEDAEMQMENILREAYMIVMVESKADFDFARRLFDTGNDSLSYAENYMDLQLESMMEDANYNVTKEKMAHLINGMPAVTIETVASIDGLNVAYLVTTVESDHDIFYITCWTLKNRKEKYFPSYYKAVETIQQLEYDLDSENSELEVNYEELLKKLELSN